MKYLIIGILLISPAAKSDTIISVLAKYGPNGYISKGTNYTYNSPGESYSENNLIVCNRIEMVYGIGMQKIPSNDGLALGVGVYFDQTLSGSIGWKFK